jgi:hypothetical protein
MGGFLCKWNSVWSVKFRYYPVNFVLTLGRPDTPGILIFFDRRDLVNDPRTVADYSKDRIVFRRQGTNDVVALVSLILILVFSSPN